MVSLFENELETHDQNPIDNNLNTIINDIKQIKFENFINDIALWPSSVTDNFREYFTLHPPNQNIQAIDESKKSIRGVSRKLKKHNFYITKKNGISVPRTWLIYSPSSFSIFCYFCKLYVKTSKHLLCKEGYSDWHHIT
jgi:hypothetical protein